MKLTLERIYKGKAYTIGHLYADDKYVCDTIEDVDRGLTLSMTEYQIRDIKVKAQTAIPTGTYLITLNIISQKFKKYSYYKDFCDGKLPRLLNVNGFDGILIHKGNTLNDSAGCIIVGYNKVKGKVINSQLAFEKLYKILEKDKNNITITIK